MSRPNKHIKNFKAEMSRKDSTPPTVHAGDLCLHIIVCTKASSPCMHEHHYTQRPGAMRDVHTNCPRNLRFLHYRYIFFSIHADHKSGETSVVHETSLQCTKNVFENDKTLWNVAVAILLAKQLIRK